MQFLSGNVLLFYLNSFRFFFLKDQAKAKNRVSIFFLHLPFYLQENTTKGQIMSECIYEINNFPKCHQKNLVHFCPGRFYRLGTYADCKCNAPLLILLIAETKYAIENNGQAIKNMKSYDLI